MRTNGTVQFAAISDQIELDDMGLPVSAETSWSKPTSCLIQVNHRNTKGRYADGEFTVSQYTILVEAAKNIGKPKRIKLTDPSGDLGEFDVQDVQELLPNGRTKITV